MLADADDGDPELILIATGSEVALAVEAHEQLAADGVRSRVVSLPSFHLFDQQDQAYRDEVLPPRSTARISIEEASTLGWDRYVGPEGDEDRHAHVRLLGAAQGRARRVRVHPGEGRRGGPQSCSTERRTQMKPTQQLHDLGQSLWVDNITRTMLDDGTLAGYIDELSVTGLTSNPTIFDKAIGGGSAYDDQVAELTEQGLEGEELFFELALTDLRRAAELFKAGPRAHDDRRARLARGLAEARRRRRRRRSSRPPSSTAAPRRTSSSRSPAPRPGRKAIEETIFAGIPVNVTLLFSTEHYLGAADAYMRGLERRVEAGLNPDVASVASLFISRWDAAVTETVPDELRNKLGIAVGKRTYAAYRELLDSDRAMRLRNEGAKAQRLLWASTGTKDPDASDVLYIEGLASPVHGQHDAREDAERVRRPRQGRRAAAARRRRRGGGAEGVQRRRASTPTRSRPSSRRTARRRSSTPGTSCSARSPRRRPRPRRPRDRDPRDRGPVRARAAA